MSLDGLVNRIINRVRRTDDEVDVVAVVSSGPPKQEDNKPHHDRRQNQKGRSAERSGHQDLVRLIQIQRRHLLKQTGTRLIVIQSGS